MQCSNAKDESTLQLYIRMFTVTSFEHEGGCFSLLGVTQSSNLRYLFELERCWFSFLSQGDHRKIQERVFDVSSWNVIQTV